MKLKAKSERRDSFKRNRPTDIMEGLYIEVEEMVKLKNVSSMLEIA